MLEIIICVLIVVVATNFEQYYKKTRDTSIEGFLEYLKDKYYTKHT